MTNREYAEVTINDLVERQRQSMRAMADESEALRQQLAEKDAKITALRDLAADHERTWRELLTATGCIYHHDALDWIRRHRAAEAAEQPDTPDAGELDSKLDEIDRKSLEQLEAKVKAQAPDIWDRVMEAEPDDGELVPWDATTRPRGVVIVRLIRRFPDSEYLVCVWTPNGWWDADQDFVDWNGALQCYEWSRDGETWQPCGTRKGVEK